MRPDVVSPAHRVSGARRSPKTRPRKRRRRRGREVSRTSSPAPSADDGATGHLRASEPVPAGRMAGSRRQHGDPPLVQHQRRPHQSGDLRRQTRGRESLTVPRCRRYRRSTADHPVPRIRAGQLTRAAPRRKRVRAAPTHLSPQKAACRPPRLTTVYPHAASSARDADGRPSSRCDNPHVLRRPPATALPRRPCWGDRHLPARRLPGRRQAASGEGSSRPFVGGAPPGRA